MSLEFTYPWFLLLLLLIPAVVVWQRWRRPRALRLPGVDLLPRVISWRARLARWGGRGLRLLGLALLMVAAAGPRWPDLRRQIDTEGIAILMVVDVSGSMAEKDFDWNGQTISRLDAVKRVFRLFVAGGQSEELPEGVDPAAFEGRPTDLIGLVTFATRPETACPLTLSHSVLLRWLDEQQPRSIPTESETNISDGIALALHRLQAAGDRRKVLVLLSDGEHNVLQPRSGWTPRQAAQIAASLSVPIYAIDAGSEVAVPEGGSSPGTTAPASSGETRAAAVHTMHELARITGGKSFSARNTAALLDACRAIDRLERSRVHSFQKWRYHEGYPWLALAAFSCWMFVLVLERTVWRRLP